ncbi:hypothetical protein ES703_77560 [subsurface metagenome]
MPEKIEIIYDFNGYANQGIRNVELTRVNGYKTIIMKEGEEKMVYQLKDITEVDVRKIIDCVDQKDVGIEDILSFLKKFIKKGKGETKMTDQETNDEKRFTEEEKKVTEYLELHKSENLTYRDAVVACLDRTEPEPKKVFTEEEIKKRENLKAVENYILANPGASYKTAVRVILRGEELTLEEKLIEEYMEKNPGSSYREAVIESLSLLEKEPKKEE